MPTKIVKQFSRKGMQNPRIVHLRITWLDDDNTNEAYNTGDKVFCLEYRDATSSVEDWIQVGNYSGVDAAQAAADKLVGRTVKANSWQDVTESQDES